MSSAGFNEKYQTFEMAHIDLAFRARAFGHACHYCPSAQVISYSVEEWDEASRNDFSRLAVEHAVQIADHEEKSGPDLSQLHDRAPTAHVLYIDADTPATRSEFWLN